MKKIRNGFKLGFYSANIILIILYLFPGSIFGCFLYDDCYRQPQITRDFIIISSNHVYAFIILSLLGIISFNINKIRILFIYLFSISIFLELCHVLIPKRSFEYSDLFGNLLGVLLIFTLFNLYQFFKSHR